MQTSRYKHKGKASPYLITERRVPELIPVLGSQPAGDVSHKPGGRLPLLSARPSARNTKLLQVRQCIAAGDANANRSLASFARSAPAAAAAAVHLGCSCLLRTLHSSTAAAMTSAPTRRATVPVVEHAAAGRLPSQLLHA